MEPTKPEMVELDGHLIFPGSTHLEPNEGIYAFTLTLGYVAGPNASGTSTRSGLVIPRPGSSLATVQSVLGAWMRRQIGGVEGTHHVLFWSFEPNVVFGLTGYGQGPKELTSQELQFEVKQFEDDQQG